MPETLGPRVATVYELQSAWLSPRLKAKGISWTTFQLIAAVHAAGDDASQVEVSRRLGVSAATLSESVRDHVAKGILEQVPSQQDRRVKVLRLTSRATGFYRDISSLVNECEALMSAGLSAKDVESCAKTLDQMIQKLERAVDA
ncbi:MAG: winged helix-turn-helix transcriptional regulator [Fimbriimonadaceae bacterium]|nr:winged helix-turn-helix transcriptional regulator [Fimbriimonadaceae bacterium]